MRSSTDNSRSRRHSDFQPFVPALIRWHRLATSAGVPSDEVLSSVLGDQALWARLELQAANDNKPLTIDREWRVRPSVAEIEQAGNVNGGWFSTGDQRSAMEVANGNNLPHFEVAGLRFSLKNGALLAYRTSRGTWVPSLERSGRQRGVPNIHPSSSTWMRLLSARPARSITPAAVPRPVRPPIDWDVLPAVRGDVPFEQARANAGLPPADKEPPGLPYSPHASQLFLAGYPAPARQPKRGPAESTFEELRSHRDLFSWIGTEQCKTLALALTARSLEDLAPDQCGKAAQRAGRERLLRAAEALRAAFERLDRIAVS